MIFTSTPVFFCSLPPPRKVVVEGSRVTSALWGPFDQFLITGHEDGTLAQYDILHVSHVPLWGTSLVPTSSKSVLC